MGGGSYVQWRTRAHAAPAMASRPNSARRTMASEAGSDWRTNGPRAFAFGDALGERRAGLFANATTESPKRDTRLAPIIVQIE